MKLRHILYGLIILAAILIAARVVRVFGASPLPVVLDEVLAFRHVLVSHDLLVLARYHLTPLEEAANDRFTVQASGGTLEPMRLTNRHTKTDTTGMTVTSGTDITAKCQLHTDQQTVLCSNTGLPNGAHNVAIAYLQGWRAYDGKAVVFQLLDHFGKAAAERTLPATGYALVGVYLPTTTVTDNFTGDGVTLAFNLSKRHFYSDACPAGTTVKVAGASKGCPGDWSFDSANNRITFTTAPPQGAPVAVSYPYTGGIIWGNTSTAVVLQASPSLWVSPASHALSLVSTFWRATADREATQRQLTSDLKDMLRRLEEDDPLVASRAYVTSAGITQAGAAVALDAWMGIISAVPNAFVDGVSNPLMDLTPPATSYISREQATAQTKLTYQAFQSLGRFFGVSPTVAGGMVFGILAAALLFFVLTKSGSVPLSILSGLAVLVFGMLVGVVPPLWVFLITGLLFAGGALWLYSRQGLG